MNELIIETMNLTKKYKNTTVVDNVNLKVQKGDIYGFLGPNGAGKTTTIRMLLGLIRESSGEVKLFNQPLHKNRIPLLRKVGSLVESPSYYGHLSGTENLEVFRRILNVPKQRIQEVLEIVRLTSASNRPVKGYSLGMKQRLGIATALLGNPELLILDEPTNGLDPAGIQEMRQLILEMPRKYGITVMVSSHLLSEIDQMATKVGVIREGKLIFQDSIETLREQNHPQVKLIVDRPLEAQKVLSQNGWVTSIDKEFLTLSSIQNEKIAQLVRLLVLNNFSIYRVEEEKRSLEDIFLELVGKGSSL